MRWNEKQTYYIYIYCLPWQEVRCNDDSATLNKITFHILDDLQIDRFPNAVNIFSLPVFLFLCVKMCALRSLFKTSFVQFVLPDFIYRSIVCLCVRHGDSLDCIVLVFSSFNFLLEIQFAWGSQSKGEPNEDEREREKMFRNYFNSCRLFSSSFFLLFVWKYFGCWCCCYCCET